MIKTRLIKLLSHAKIYVILQVVYNWLALLCQVVNIYCVANLLEKAYQKTLTNRLVISYAVVILGCIILRNILNRCCEEASHKASVDVKRILRGKIYDKLLRLGTSYREQVATSEIVQLASEGVEQLETYFGKYLSQFFYSLLAPLTLFLILSRVNLRASVVLLICVPLIPISIVAVMKIGKKLLNKYWGVYAELGDSFLENLQGLTTLKIYQADGQAADDMDVEAQHFRTITMKVLTMQLNSTSIMDIMAYGGAAVGMIVTIQQYIAGNVTMSGALMIILLASEFFLPLRLLGSFFHIAMNGMAASDKIFALLDMEEPKTEGASLTDADMDLRIEDLHFAYHDAVEREVLHGISMEANKGQLVAFVGQSGCGKSTVAGILSGRNKGYTGHVTLQGLELSEISEDSLMRHITTVTHNSFLFHGTVEENLRMGRGDASREELIDALRRVNLYEELNRSQNGLDTVLLEGGSNLSGGQRQRLAMARALLHDTEVYILDEATSNIDVESEEMIMDIVKEMAKEKTVILISHRLANVVTADCIYMMEGGNVVEHGCHADLLAAGGSYARLYESQHALETYGQEGSL